MQPTLTVELGISILGGDVTAPDVLGDTAIDIVPVDRWTVSHTRAVLVFDVWFVPLVWTLLIVIGWEMF